MSSALFSKSVGPNTPRLTAECVLQAASECHMAFLVGPRGFAITVILKSRKQSKNDVVVRCVFSKCGVANCAKFDMILNQCFNWFFIVSLPFHSKTSAS